MKLIRLEKNNQSLMTPPDSPKEFNVIKYKKFLIRDKNLEMKEVMKEVMLMQLEVLTTLKDF